MPEYTKLRASPDVSDAPLKEAVAENVRDYLAWAFLEAGAFGTATVPTPGTPDPYGDETFRPVAVQGVADYRTWAAPHAHWCPQPGLERAEQPTVCDGVYVDGVLRTAADGVSFDFVRGTVTLPTPLLPASVVQAGYSWRYYPVYGDDVPWFRQVIVDGYLAEQQAEGGILGVLEPYGVRPPFVLVEAAAFTRSRGWALGGDRVVRNDLVCHVVAADKRDRDRLVAWLADLRHKRIRLYDVDARRDAGDFPLDAAGAPVPGARTYPGLVADSGGYRWGLATFADAYTSQPDPLLPLHRAAVRLAVEVIVGRG